MPTAVSSPLPKVCFLGNPNHVELQRLEDSKKIMDITIMPQLGREEQLAMIPAFIKEHGPFVAWCWFIDWNIPSPFPLNKELASPFAETGCKFFTHPNAGYENVDVKYLTSMGAIYANNPQCVGIRTADTCATMIMQVMRARTQHEANTRKGIWHEKMSEILVKDNRHSTLGIIGMGRIGKMVAAHMMYFGMKVIYTKRTRLPAEEENGATYVSMDELLARSDVISLNCPLNQNTHHLLSDKEFQKMKDNVIIVNTARGAVIDEQALVDALESGKVLRAALDVYEFEPKIHPGLIASEKTILSPHNAVVNDTLLPDQQLEVLENCEAFIQTGRPNTGVN